MAFVRARDMLGDRGRVTESVRLGEFLGSAGKAPWTRATERAKHCLESEQQTETKEVDKSKGGDFQS